MTAMHTIACPNCNASVEVADSVGEFRCPYCDSTIMVEFESSVLYEAQLRQKEVEGEERLKARKVDHEAKVAEFKAQESFLTTKLLVKCLGVLIAVMLAWALISMIGDFINGLPVWVTGESILIVVATAAYIAIKLVSGKDK